MRVTREDSSLDGGTEGNSLIGVDGLVGLLAVEELLETSFWTLGIRVEPPTRTMSSTSDFLILASLRTCSTGSRVLLEEIQAELLEPGTGDGGVEVDTLEERLDLDGGLSLGRQSTLGLLASSCGATQGT